MPIYHHPPVQITLLSIIRGLLEVKLQTTECVQLGKLQFKKPSHHTSTEQATEKLESLENSNITYNF